MNKLKLEINSRIEVISKEKSYKSLILDSNEDFIVMNLPVNDGEYLILEEGDKVEMNSYTDNAGYFNFFANVISKGVEGNIAYYKLTLPYNSKRIQRRNFFRVSLIKFIGYKNITNINKEEIEEIPFKEALMIDLSGGGIKLKIKEDIQKKDLLLIKLKVKDQEMILKGDIVRLETALDKEKLCGVRFLDITQSQCDKIIEELFEIMRKQRATL